MRSPFDLLMSSERVHPRSIAWESRMRAAVCIAAALTSMTGCRSSMPKLNMFGFKSEPSADALAGAGPTTTYPLSPSSTVSPEAIASTAAGTGAPSGLTPQTSNVAATTTPTNQAAAAANGFYGPGSRTGTINATPASFASNPSASPGFSYGQNPAATGASSVTGSPTGGVNALAASFTPAANAVPAYAQGATPAATQTQNATQSTAYSAVPGYPLPGSGDAVPASPSTSMTSTAPSFAMPNAAPIPGAMTAPTATSTASSTGGFTMPGTAPADETVATAPAPTRSPAPTAPSTGYAPGSTAGAVGYPSGNSFPSTGSSDTFYR